MFEVKVCVIFLIKVCINGNVIISPLFGHMLVIYIFGMFLHV